MQCLLVCVVILSLSLATEINNKIVIELVNKLCDFYKLETLIIFPDFSMNFDSQYDLSKELQQSNNLPQLKFNKFSLDELKLIVNRDRSLSIMDVECGLTSFRNILGARLRGMHSSKVLIVLREPVVSKTLIMLGRWLWQRQFNNVLVIFEDSDTHQSRIYAMDPYPILKWSNRTAVNDSGKLFPEVTRDLKNYRIQTPFMEDIPGTFIFRKNGDSMLVGNDASYILTFAKFMNIKLIPKLVPKLNFEKVLRILRFNGLELSVHSFSMNVLTQFGKSYPIEMERWCVMVPFRNELPKSKLVFKAFDKATWLVMGFGVAYVAWMLRFVDPPLTQTTPYCQYFLQSLAMLTYNPNMVYRVALPSGPKCVFYFFVCSLGFVLYCLYTTFLARFCTTLVFRDPIDSIDGLIKENLRIMTIDYEVSAIRMQANYDEDFYQLLYPMAYHDVVIHRSSFDTNFAYTISQSDWIHLDKQQSKLKKPLFRISKICYGRHFKMFPLQYDSHLKPHLDDFILRVKEAGLDVVWKDQSFRMSLSMNYSKILTEQTAFIQPLSLEFFKNVFIVWFLGIALAVGCFVVEISWKRLNVVRKLVR